MASVRESHPITTGNEITAQVVSGLARMEDHFGALYGDEKAKSDELIEAYAAALFDSWPVEEVQEWLFELSPQLQRQTIPTVRAIVTVLAGRMFLAGRESVVQCGTNKERTS